MPTDHPNFKLSNRTKLKTPTSQKEIKMKSILCLATVCLFALASAAVIPPEQSPDQFSSLGLIKVPEAFLLKPVQALLKIYVVSPLNGQKLQVFIDLVCLLPTFKSLNKMAPISAAPGRLPAGQYRVH